MSKLNITRQANNRQMRKARTRAKLSHSPLPRLMVTRSNKYMFAQVVAPGTGKAVAGVRAVKPETVGEEVAKKAIASGIKQVVFDRGPYSYHGRVKAVAEAARKGGLEF